MQRLFPSAIRFLSGGVALLAITAVLAQTGAISAQSAVYEVVSKPTLMPGDPIPQPAGPTVLQVKGRIGAGNDNTVAFDLPTLERLGVVRFTTPTNWTKDAVTFEGVLLSRVLDMVGADAEAANLVLTALNDYSVPIPISDPRNWPVILAFKENGSYMSRRGRGPLWVVYPQHAYPEFGGREYISRWVWQLAKITVE